MFFCLMNMCNILTRPLRLLLAAKINETDTFGPGDDDEIQFDDIGDDDEDIDDVSSLHTLLINFSWISIFARMVLLEMYFFPS